MILLLLAALALRQTPPAGGEKPAALPVPAANAELVPGILPKDAAPEACALWNSLAAALGPKGETRAPISAFELSITTRIFNLDESGKQQQTNDVQVRFRYLAPGFVSRAIVDAKGNLETMRGPDGDWLWDADKEDRVQLAGKDYAKDRRELSQTLSMARNYVALADPGKLRIAKLERLRAPPPQLPVFDPKDPAAPLDSALSIAASLEWISVLSPDFQVVEPVKSASAPLFRAQLGLDPKSHLPLLAIIFQEEQGTNLWETSALIDFTKDTKKPDGTPKHYMTYDGYLVPTFFRVHDPLLPSSPFTFQREPHMAVVVKDSKLRAKLSPEDFRPPPANK